MPRNFLSYVVQFHTYALLREGRDIKNNIFDYIKYFQQELKAKKEESAMIIAKFPQIVKIGIDEFKKRVEFLQKQI